MKIINHKFSTFQKLQRDLIVRVALPDNLSTDNSIPLLLTHDAQNIFDIWHGEETKTFLLPKLDKMFAEGFPPFALIGVDTWETGTGYQEKLERFTDFSPWKSSCLFQYLPSWPDNIIQEVGGRGDIYADYLINTILPFVEKEYSIGGCSRLRGIAGSSMGAMISLYIGTKYNELFSYFGFLSPALWCFKQEYINYLQTIPSFKINDKIYIEIGRKESSDPQYTQFNQEYLEGAYTIFDLLKNKAPNLVFAIDENGEHDMPSISTHFLHMIKFFENCSH